ncbi:MAG: menaquinone biosynthesis decarboxylase [Thermodesulfobacteriota bacterium]|nr:menaquinone biosynthesis decarboxylase [Thermodesulfobacteriota bacterium]
MYKNLHGFISRLETAEELTRIRIPVSSELEITEITDREAKSPGGGKALLFEDVEGSCFPVLTNAFGSHKRICMALGCSHLDELGERLRDILTQSPPRTFMEKLRFLPLALDISRYLPRTKNPKNAPCQEIVYTGAAIDLSMLPVLKCWPEDGGPFITLPVVFTKGLDNKRNAGMYRMQIYDKNTTGMHWHIHKDASHQFNEYKERNKRMEVAVAIGADPVVTYAATAPMPRGVDEMLLAGFIRKTPVDMVKCLTVDLEVPMEAEIILEGYVDPNETRTEGPFGDHTGYYSPTGPYPVFHVTALTHRCDPIYPATVVGRPPMEDCYLALATERLFLPMIETIMPEIRDYYLPWEGVFHNIVIVAIEKEYPLHAMKVINGLWGSGQMSFAKAILVIDDTALLHDRPRLLRYILDTIDLDKDICLSRGILDVLDHSAPNPLYGSKIGIDATGRIDGEEKRPLLPYTHLRDAASMQETLKKMDKGFVSMRPVCLDARNPLFLVCISKNADKNSAFFIKRIIEHIEDIASTGIMVLYDADTDLNDDSLVLWRAFNNTDPSRDIHHSNGALIIDATRKDIHDLHSRPWPHDITMTDTIKKRVDAKAALLHLSKPSNGQGKD